MAELLPVAVLSPAVAAIAIALLGERLPKAVQGWVAVLGAAVSLGCVITLATSQTSTLGFEPVAWFGGDWILTADLQAAFVLYFDRVALLMGLLVTGFGTLIVLYSVQYMDHEDGTPRFFASISLFLAAMLMLVFGENLFLIFIGWEGVGLASYLLIGHYWKTDFAPPAAMRAFFVNRVGDVFFLIGVFLLFQATGTVSLPAMSTPSALAALGENTANSELLGYAALFLLGGIFGKSAQMPLHVWLPDAMAGPTPVSALIHAATMVTSGIYLMTRLDWLYAVAPGALYLVFVASLVTLLVGSTLACLQSDIKKVLAYSTLAHLALMFLALSAGDSPAGMMHLFGHAAFKALLFLAAGSVIYFQHHEQDLNKLRGVLGRMPVTRAAFWIGAIGAAGFLPFVSASFFSKDLVMHAVGASHGGLVYWLVFVAELLGVVYMFRLLGYLESAPTDSASARKIAGEHGWIIRLVLAILVIFAPVFGWISASPGYGGSGWLYGMIAGAKTVPEPAVSSLVKNLVSGLAIAAGVFWLYARSARAPAAEARLAGATPVRRLYFFDDVYSVVILQPLAFLARTGFSLLEGPFFAGALRQAGSAFQTLSQGVSKLQSGYVNHYALVIVILLTGILGLLGALWFRL